VRETEALARKAVEGPKPGKARTSSAGASGEGAADVAALQQDGRGAHSSQQQRDKHREKKHRQQTVAVIL
jgi:hypothetical protein